MSKVRWLTFVVLLAGCAGSNEKGPAPGGQAKKTEAQDKQDSGVQASLAKLSDADRDAAQTQKVCAIHGDNLLGSMGPPVKITVKSKDGEEVTAFLCCKGCEKAALKDEAKTAAVVSELNIAGNIAKLGDDDREDAQTQKFCAIHGD